MGMIVITGATGFVGTNLIAHFRRVRPESELLCLGRNRRKLSALVDAENGVFGVAADVLDPLFVDTVTDAVGGRPVDCLVHLASRLSSPSDDVDCAMDTLRVNELGAVAAWRLMERLSHAGGVAAAIHLSSILVYGRTHRDPVLEDSVLAPRDVYGASKVGSEHVARYFSARFGVPLTIIRPGFIYGPNDGSGKVIYRFVDAALRGDDLVIRADPDTFRDYVNVSDVCRVIAAAIAAPPKGQTVINASGGEAVTLSRLASVACAVTGSHSRVIIDQPEDFTGDPLYGCVVADSRKLRAMIGALVPLVDGVGQLSDGRRG